MSSVESPEEAGTSSALSPAWWRDVSQLGQAAKTWGSVQFSLLSAELGLARSALSLLLLMGLLATVAGVGLMLTLLILLGFGLAYLFHSWIWALVALAGLQMIGLLLAIWLFRRCMHWMSLPQTRQEGGKLIRSLWRSVESPDDSEE